MCCFIFSQPYAVKIYKCLAGIQVTASHNPKEYNGYKVYWDNGAQVGLQLSRRKGSHSGHESPVV